MSKQIKNGATSSKRFNEYLVAVAAKCSTVDMSANGMPVRSVDYSPNMMPVHSQRYGRHMRPCW